MFSFKNLAKKLLPLVVVGGLYEKNKTAYNFFWSSKKKETENEKTDIYLWGNGYYQSRPENINQNKNFVPKKIIGASENNTKIVKNIPFFQNVLFDEKNGFGLDKEGKVYVFDNRKISSFEDDSNPKNYIIDDSKKISKDNLLNNLKKLDIRVNVKKMTLTNEYFWMINNKGDLYRLPLAKLADPNANKELKKINSINNLEDISSGENHLLMLKKNGELFSMGDDTFGQCGLGSMGRSQGGPFVETKVPNPEKIAFFQNVKVSQIYSKMNFNYVVTENKEVYAFGSNSHMQMAHELDYSKNINPKVAVFDPLSMNNYLREVNCDLKKIALGNEFTIFSCVNSENKRSQVFGCGNNMFGQLGNGYIKHVNNFQKIENLSDYTIPMEDGSEKNVEVDDISCGDNHCMALLNIGVIMIWGVNEYGQLGNKKRSFSTKPLISSRFNDKQILKIKADYRNNFVITKQNQDVEDKDKKEKIASK
jgi:alpha-tubulin suppressor-like RCC1 family protein